MVFNFKQDGFDISDLGNALILAQMSDLAYKSSTGIENELRKTGDINNFRFIDNSGTQCFLVGTSDGLILSFRGTEQSKLRDWLTDMDTFKVPGPWGRVHRGFSVALDKVWEDLLGAVKEFQASNLQPLWVTGHSLGGALAVLAAARFLVSGRPVKGLYTFGQPRVGDKEFSMSFDGRIVNTVRFVNNEDIVARVPKFRYEHIGDKCYFDRNKKSLWNPSRMETWIDCLEEINFRSLHVENRFLNRHPNCLEDHLLDGYISAIRKNMPPSHGKKPHSDFSAYVNKL